MVKQQITVFEHDSLLVNYTYNNVQFCEEHLNALIAYYGEGNYKPSKVFNFQSKHKYTADKNNFPFYTLIKNGVKFHHYVGVLQVKDLVIEVLPKADKQWSNQKNEQTNWRNMLVKMLKITGAFDINITGFSNLNLNPNHFLEVYFEIFVLELERLIQQGLIKKYRDIQENKTSLVGSLLFSKQIQHNLVHCERFYVQTSEYDTLHTLHAILMQALKKLHYTNKQSSLKSRINKLLLDFPEPQNVNISENTFSKIFLNRKSSNYKNSLLIAKMILLELHPDMVNANNEVLCLMFDMNVLWEKFIFKTLQSSTSFNEVYEQVCVDFWGIGNTNQAFFKADIIIVKNGINYVLDTKWKNLVDNNPNNDDLRQMFAYLHYYNSPKTALLYPGKIDENLEGEFYIRKHDPRKEKCSILKSAINEEINVWQENICRLINSWVT